MYEVCRAPQYDFAQQTYSGLYPNLHKYPATMLPQIGIGVLRELNIRQGRLFDPYCGSGSSFASGLECGLREMCGYDLNPLALLISRAKFTVVNLVIAQQQKHQLRSRVYDLMRHEHNIAMVDKLRFYNGDYWFSEQAIRALSVIHHFLQMVEPAPVRQLFSVAFAETIRDVSYTRNGEFKLYRIKPDRIVDFNPDVLSIFFDKLDKVISVYKQYYYPKLGQASITICDGDFPSREAFYNVVLTSPPYGDSRTTVAYGQFSRFANEWLGVPYARQVDRMLMGGRTSSCLYLSPSIETAVQQIDQLSPKRALEVSSFYRDLQKSIVDVAKTVKRGGWSVYIVGNRRVKNIQLPTDQFIAEQFEALGFRHAITYERQIGGKVMPSVNSPSNVKGDTSETMSQEFIVISQRVV